MKTPLYEQLSAYVLDQVGSGQLKPGDRVPSEKELAEQFNVSRITSKKALGQLVLAGVIERVRGRGSFVANKLPDLARIDLSQRSTFSSTDGPSRTNERRIIGLIVPDFSEAYGLKLLHAIEERCSDHHYALVLKRTYGRREEEEQAIRSFVGLGVDGLIVFPVHGEYYNADLLRLVLDDFPLVMVDRYLKGIAASAVYTDNNAAAYEITTYLLEQGHTHIAFVSPPIDDTSSIEERFQGFGAALSHHGLTPSPELCLTGLLSTLPEAFHTAEIGIDENTVRDFIAANPLLTAFVACEYNLALLLVDVLAAMGKHVPEDYAIACFDSPESPFGTPPFTHIKQDETAMGRTAVDLLVARLAGEDSAARTVIGFRLVEGQSTRRVSSAHDERLVAAVHAR